MSSKPDFTPLLSMAHQLIADEDLADLAAENLASGQIFKGEVHDKVEPDIVVGHMIVVCIYGSESQVNRVYNAIVPHVKVTGKYEGDIYPEQLG